MLDVAILKSALSVCLSQDEFHRWRGWPADIRCWRCRGQPADQ